MNIENLEPKHLKIIYEAICRYVNGENWNIEHKEFAIETAREFNFQSKYCITDVLKERLELSDAIITKKIIEDALNMEK
jgi:hypothetical protein